MIDSCALRRTGRAYGLELYNPVSAAVTAVSETWLNFDASSIFIYGHSDKDDVDSRKDFLHIHWYISFYFLFACWFRCSAFTTFTG